MACNITLKSHLRKVGSNIVIPRALWTENPRRVITLPINRESDASSQPLFHVQKQKSQKSLRGSITWRGNEGQDLGMTVVGCSFSSSLDMENCLSSSPSVITVPKSKQDVTYKHVLSAILKFSPTPGGVLPVAVHVCSLVMVINSSSEQNG